MDRGVRPSAALAFLLSAPAINPIVLVATAVAFSTEPDDGVGPVGRRTDHRRRSSAGSGSGSAARSGCVRGCAAPLTEDARGWSVFLNTMRGDFTQAAGFLVLGGGVAATFKVLVSQGWLQHIGSSLVLSVILMAVLAYMLALCSEADAFVAASFTTIPMIGKLVFLTVGPGGRRQADRAAGRHVRPPVRVAVRAADVRRSRWSSAVVVGIAFWGL